MRTTVPARWPRALALPLARSLTWLRKGLALLVAPMGRAPTALLALLALGSVAAWIYSLRWGIQNDGPVVIYPAHLMRTGQRVLYADLFDMNQPGAFLAMGVVDLLAGHDDQRLRAIDVALLASTCALTPLALRMPRALPGLAASFAYALFHLRETGLDALQREVWIVFLVIVSGALLARRRPFAAGVVAGLAVFVKFHALLLAVVLLVGHLHRVGRGRTAARWIAGVITTGAALVGSLALVGAADDWWWIVRHYLPLYTQMAGNLCFEPDLARGWAERARLLADPVTSPTLVLLPVAGWLALRVDPRSRWARTAWMAAALAVLGWLHPAPGGNFWRYQQTPAWFAAGLVIALAIGVPRGAMRAFAIERLAVVSAALFLAYGALRPYADDALAHRRDSGVNPSAAALAHYLRQNLAPGDTVQPLDTVLGAVDGMWRADARLATSFAYGFYFYQSPTDPTIRTIRRRFVAELEAARPRFVVRGVGSQALCTGWNTTTSFPELDALLDAHYEQVATTGTLFVLARRDPWDEPAPASLAPSPVPAVMLAAPEDGLRSGP